MVISGRKIRWMMKSDLNNAFDVGDKGTKALRLT